MEALELTTPAGSLAASIDNSMGARLSRVADVFLANRKPATVRSYRSHLDGLARFLGLEDYRAAGAYLATRTRGQAYELVTAYTAYSLGRGMSNGTVNVALAVLKGLSETANNVGLIEWTLPRSLKKLEDRPYRDTAGPGLDGYRAMLAQLGDSPKARRDRAILWLLGAGCGLRRFELTGLDVSHVNIQEAKISLLGKRRSAREWKDVPPEALAALADWISVRGSAPGPLFTSFDRARKGTGRLSNEAVWHVVRGLGRAAGLGTVRPHGLRHTAITAMLDAGETIAEVQGFSRHADPKTLFVYDDNRKRRGAQAAARLCATI